jgi:hypothetical protein
MTAVARTLTSPTRTMTVMTLSGCRCRHATKAMLADGHRVVLLDDRGWSEWLGVI